MNDKPFAEVIESSLTGWLAQSWQWDTFPSFGSLVIINNPHRIVFGIVHQIKTGSLDSSRYPFTYQKTHEELLREQPQIFEFLKTTFSCLPVGYKENDSIFYQLAPEPPKIHDFIQPASKKLFEEFFQQEYFLSLLFGFSETIFNLDELLLAIINEMNKFSILSQNKIERFCETFSLLTGNDYRRLKLFLNRVEHVL